ncbi:MAG: addiction module toxin RelE [Candidatus Altiarchaeota archaeon]
MREFSLEDDLKRILIRLQKKDKRTYEAIMAKIDEILSCNDINHYKNLKKPLQHLKRVHVNGPFVLTFRYVVPEDKIIFYDFDHHDKIYRR